MILFDSSVTEWKPRGEMSRGQLAPNVAGKNRVLTIQKNFKSRRKFK